MLHEERTNRSSLTRLVAVFVTFTVLVATVFVASTPDAEALDQFDSEILEIINDHRLALNLPALIEQPSMSIAARNWSTEMRERSLISGCQGPRDMFVQNDTPFNIATQGTVDGTISSDESVGWICGFPGRTQESNFTYAGLPSGCYEAIDASSALYMACLWLNGGQREKFESPNFTHIGIGSNQKLASRNSLITFATVRFAQAPAGPQIPICANRTVTVNLQTDPGAVATEGDDVILGTEGDDIIDGLGGNDTICGLGGRDVIRGGEGRDVIFGDDGNDWIFAGSGADEVHGGLGIDAIWGDADADELHGDGGSDYIWGGTGADVIRAGAGADRVWGEDGPDQLHGMGGQDFMWGGDGDDDMQGNWQSDWMYGEAGNDTIRGSGGKDKLYGGEGDDALYGGANSDFLDGGLGNDSADGQRGREYPFVTDETGCIAEVVIAC